MAESGKVGAIASRAALNVQLCVGSSQFHRDVRRHLRNCAGTIPFYDPRYLNGFAPKLFEGAPFMASIFLSVIKTFPDKVEHFGSAKIEVPFHTMDCGLCMYLACFVSSSLNSKHYNGSDFAKLHSNLQHQLTIHQTGSEREGVTDLAAHKFHVKGSNSYWVVSAFAGYGAAKPFCAGNVEYRELASASRDLDAPSADGDVVPDYSVLSPELAPPPTPRKKAKGKRQSVVSTTRSLVAKELIPETSVSRPAIRPMESVFTDSDDDSD